MRACVRTLPQGGVIGRHLVRNLHPIPGRLRLTEEERDMAHFRNLPSLRMLKRPSSAACVKSADGKPAMDVPVKRREVDSSDHDTDAARTTALDEDFKDNGADAGRDAKSKHDS
jgi:hypothetical protein